MPFVVSHNGQILKETAAFICRQIEQKLMAVDGRVKQSKKQAIWKLWTRHISMATNKTASRNILRKITKMVSDSNEQQRRTSASVLCEDPFRRQLLAQRSLNIILIFLLIIRIFVNVIFQVIKIELKIAMRKKPIIPTRKVNMYFNRLVLTSWLSRLKRSSVRFWFICFFRCLTIS